MYQFANIATLNLGLGLKHRTIEASNPEQAKDFVRESISSENPKIGRMPLIL
jgi:hypothetical protein